MATVSWTTPTIGNTSLGEGTSAQNYSNFVLLSGSYDKVGSVSQITYTAWYSRTDNVATEIQTWLRFGSSSAYDQIDMGTKNYNNFSSGTPVSRTYTVTFSPTTSPSCYEVASYVRKGLYQRRISWSPKNTNNSGGSLLYYRSLQENNQDRRIIIEVTYSEDNNNVKYYINNEWKDCAAYYYDQTAGIWKPTNMKYYTNNSF